MRNPEDSRRTVCSDIDDFIYEFLPNPDRILSHREAAFVGMFSSLFPVIHC